MHVGYLSEPSKPPASFMISHTLLLYLPQLCVLTTCHYITSNVASMRPHSSILVAMVNQSFQHGECLNKKSKTRTYSFSQILPPYIK